MIQRYLMAMGSLALADLEPCPPLQCPAGWRNAGGDCLMLAGWEERRAREVCRENRAELLQWGNSSTVRLCLLRGETQCQCGRYYNGTGQGEGGLSLAYPWQGTVQDLPYTIIILQ